MTRRIPLVVTVLVLLGVASASLAWAQTPAAPDGVEGEVLIVLARREAGTIDPRLSTVPALRRSPFDMFHSMSLLSSPRVHLRVGQAEVVPLPNGRRVRLVLREMTSSGRFRLQLSINRPGQRDYLPEMNVVVSPGDPVFIAGQSHENGTLVIGIRLGQRPDA
ncbi:MAG TPA: hypothetical protein ENK57_12835 [Polyangiaceae bacterium]|nr:hypothetical protein [Polyangiaceae bacterium]